MLERDLTDDCNRCRGTGTVTPLKGQRFIGVTMICSCRAGRGIASHVGLTSAAPLLWSRR